MKKVFIVLFLLFDWFLLCEDVLDISDLERTLNLLKKVNIMLVQRQDVYRSFICKLIVMKQMVSRNVYYFN